MMKCENVEVLPIAKSNSNWKLATLALATLATMATFAKTFDVDISTGRPAASNEAYYHGETIEFRAVRGRSVVTNVEYSCVYYQTNGMDSVWWHTDGLVFHPTNDVGAASYRFFLEGRDDLGRDWHANGLLRLLPSPGFTPNEIELPVARLDFANIEVANDPWTEAIESNRVEIATVRVGVASNSAAIATNSDAIAEIAGTTSALSDSISTLSTNVYTKAETDAAIAAATPAETDPVWDREKSGYATIQALEEGDIVPDRANKANYANLAGLASNAAELGDRSATVILTQLDAATATNALQDAELESLSDSISTLNDTKASKADIDAAISPTSPAFSNAVLSVGLGIDTNTVAVINELVDSAHDLPVSGATSVGALLLALAAAVAALKKRLPYALVTKSIENGAVSLDDRASNAVEISSTLSPNTLTINFPAEPIGKARDFALRLNIASGVTAPELVLPQGVVCENADGEVPEISDGETGGSSTILYFSETENNGTTAKFLLKGETLAAITQA